MWIFCYHWQARHASHALESGTSWAINTTHLHQQQTTQSRYIFTEKITGIRWFQPYKPKQRAVFFKKLYTLLEAGFHLKSALHALEKQEQHQQFKFFLQHAQTLIACGDPLSTAMQQHSYLFNPLCIALIQAGEHSGKLAEVCARLSEYEHHQAQWQNNLQQACLYPASILCFGLIITFLLMHFVLPQTVSLYTDSNQEIPQITRILHRIYQQITQHFLPIMFCSAGLLFWFRRTQHQILPHMPWLKTLYQLRQNTHFIYTLTLCYKSGLPLRKALMLAMACIQKALSRQDQLHLVHALDDGHTLSTQLELLNIFPDFVIDMLRTGENTGQFEKMGNYAGQWLDTEVKHRIDLTLKIIEPLLLLVLAVMIGLLMVTFYLPLFDMAELAV